MRAGPCRATAGAGLTSRSLPSEFPQSLRAGALLGEDAARRASLVSGPFQASPLAYLSIRDEGSLAQLLRWAHADGTGLIPRGAGTGMPGGNLGAGVVFEIGPGFDEIVAVDDDGGRLRTGASAVADAVDRVARRHGRFLPFLPSSSRWCSVGGMIGTNAAGARSFAYGSIARWIESIEGFYASGEKFRLKGGVAAAEPFATLRERLVRDLDMPGDVAPGWPRVRKNSSGYALDRFLPAGDGAQLLAGSEGTLAVITSAELRTARLPSDRGLALLSARSPEELTLIALEAEALGATACEFFGRRFLELAELDSWIVSLARGAFALVVVEASGTSRDVREVLGAVCAPGTGERASITTLDPAEMARVWELRRAASPTIAREADRGRLSTQFIEDSVVPPRALGAYLEGLERILDAQEFDAVVFGHAGDANVHVNPLIDTGVADWRERARNVLYGVAELVRSLGGTLSGEHGDGRVRTPLIPEVWPAPLARAFRVTKEALDPGAILNPGVIVPLPGQDPLEGLAPRVRPHPEEAH